MADFWGGFGQGFAPSYEKALDRRRAEKKRLAEIERLAEIAKQERLGKIMAYQKALGEEEFRGLLPESGRTPINPEVYPADSIWTGAGPLPRQYRPLEDVMGEMGKKERIGLEYASKFAYAAKLEEDKREEAARLLRDKYAHEKGLLSAKQIADDFKSDFEATKADLEVEAAGGATKIPLGRLNPFREGQQKRLRLFFDTAVTKYNNASVVERDADWKKYAMILAPYASTQYNFKMPPLPPGSRITPTESVELWNAYLLGEGKIVGARADVKRTQEKGWAEGDLAVAKDKVEDRMEKLVRGYVGLRGIDWNENAQRMLDKLMDSIMVPEDAWKVHGKMVESVDNQQLLDQVKDSDFFAEEARNLVKKVMADPFLRTNPKAMDFLMKNISPEKTSAWRKQFAEWKTLKTKRDAAKSKAARAEIQEEMNFIHRKANPFGKESTQFLEVLKLLEDLNGGGSGGDGSQPPPVKVEKPLELPPLPGDQGVPKKEAVPPDAKPLPPEARVTAEGVIIGNVTYPIGKPLGNEGGPKYEIIIINGKPYQRPVK